MATNKPYSSDEEFDDFDDYEEHLGKCKKHINNVAVANKVRTQAAAKKVNNIPKEQNKKEQNKKEQNTKPLKNDNTLANDNTLKTTTIEINSNTHFKPIITEEPVDDWEDLM
jgi:hypothetical protein